MARVHYKYLSRDATRWHVLFAKRPGCDKFVRRLSSPRASFFYSPSATKVPFRLCPACSHPPNSFLPGPRIEIRPLLSLRLSRSFSRRPPNLRCLQKAARSTAATTTAIALSTGYVVYLCTYCSLQRSASCKTPCTYVHPLRGLTLSSRSRSPSFVSSVSAFTPYIDIVYA